MTDNTTKLHVEIGDFSISYEGPADLLEERLTPLVREILSIGLEGSGAVRRESRKQEARSASEEDPPVGADLATGVVGTLNNVAAKLDCKTGPELIVATAAFLTFGAKAMQRFGRKDLLDEMKMSSYYKASFSSNMSTYLQRLVKKQELTEAGKNVYQLPPARHDELKARLYDQV